MHMRPREEGEIRQNHRISSTMKNAGSWNPPGPRQGARAPEEAKRNLLKTTPKTVDAYEYLLDKHLFKTTTDFTKANTQIGLILSI